MRSRPVVVAVLVSLLTGCATVREVDLDSGGSRLAEINAAAKGKKTTVELVSGQTHSALKLDVGPDTTCWTEGDGMSWMRDVDQERVCVPTSEVRKITVHRRLRGGLQGGGIGLGAGVAAVVLPLVVLACSGDVGDAAGEGLVMFAIYGVPAGGVIGTVVGAAIGVARGKDVYVLNP